MFKKVFSCISFIIFIKERYSFTILSKKKRAPGGSTPWAELKSDEHLSAITSKTHTFDAVSLTVCSSESWPESFLAETAPSFSIKRCANPASNWALFIKHSSINTLEKLCCFPGKTNCIHCLRNAGFFRKLNKVIFLSQPKTHFFRDILSERVPCSRKSCVDGRTLSLAPVDVCMGSFSRGKCPYKSSTVVYISKSHDLKNSQKLGRTRKWGFWHRNTVQIVFLKLCPCLAWETKS